MNLGWKDCRTFQRRIRDNPMRGYHQYCLVWKGTNNGEEEPCFLPQQMEDAHRGTLHELALQEWIGMEI